MNFSKKQKGKFSFNDFLIKILAILLVIIIIILLMANIKIYKKRKGLESEVLKYERQIAQLKEKNTNLEKKIENSDNTDYIEKVAREEQNMQKPGEKVVSFIMPVIKEQDQASVQEFWNAKSWLGWLSNSWNWIKSLI